MGHQATSPCLAFWDQADRTIHYHCTLISVCLSLSRQSSHGECEDYHSQPAVEVHNDAEENGVARCIGIVSLQMPFGGITLLNLRRKFVRRELKVELVLLMG